MTAHKVVIAMRAECECGWKSDKEHRGAAADRAALIEWAEHARSCNGAGK